MSSSIDLVMMKYCVLCSILILCPKPFQGKSYISFSLGFTGTTITLYEVPPALYEVQLVSINAHEVQLVLRRPFLVPFQLWVSEH